MQPSNIESLQLFKEGRTCGQEQPDAGCRKRPEKPKSSEELKTEAEKEEEAEIARLKKGIKPDSYAESLVRKYATTKAAGLCYALYDVYKKAHGMMSTPGPA